MNTIDICLSCDDNYSKYAGVVVASVLKNAKPEDNLRIYILDGGISQENKSNKTRNCDKNKIFITTRIFKTSA